MVTLSYRLLCVRGALRALSRSVKQILTSRTGIPQEHIVKSVRAREDIMTWETGMMGWKSLNWSEVGDGESRESSIPPRRRSLNHEFIRYSDNP